jgi:branched-chain amino acid transport system substrate-binding protein
MASYNDAPAEKDDIYRILAQVQPQDVEDKGAVDACKLEPLAATPSYEQ